MVSGTIKRHFGNLSTVGGQIAFSYHIKLRIGVILSCLCAVVFDRFSVMMIMGLLFGFVVEEFIAWESAYSDISRAYLSEGCTF